MRRAAKLDDNHHAIADGLAALGRYSVRSTAGLGDGFPDLAVGWRSRGGRPLNALLEVKKPRGKLTPKEADFHSGWRGQVAVVDSLHAALDVLAEMENDADRRGDDTYSTSQLPDVRPYTDDIAQRAEDKTLKRLLDEEC